MRTLIVALFLLVGLSLAGVSHAQTWESPLTFNSNPYISYGNSCNQPPQYLILDVGEYQLYAPVVVYRVWNLQFPPPYPKITFKPRNITLTPQAYVDLSIWVCRTRTGAWLTNCVDASDDGPGLNNTVTVPPQAGVFYVAITGGVDQTSPNCGPYILNSYY